MRPLKVLLLAALCIGGARADAPVVCVPRLTHPGLGQVIYFVMTDRFENGSSANDAGGLSGGPDVTGFDPTRTSHYHGGDFVGLTRRLDYIQHLGATAVWVTPAFVNDPVERTAWGVSAGYHGYWITDFTHIDPHLGTDAEFRAFVDAAHARGIRVYMDIVVNHTADIIQYKQGKYDYVPLSGSPYRDSSGKAFDIARAAYNGVGPGDFPPLSADGSFPYTPVVPPGKEHVKAPDWLNDVTLYHNRGNSTFKDESATYGDFGGLDDVMTEHPRVVRGFIDVFSRWIRDGAVDGFRIDTVKHVNIEFWQAFTAAMRQQAAAVGRPDFIEFGEVMSGDPDTMSYFTTSSSLDGTIDFGFYEHVRDYLSKGADAAGLDQLFEQDGRYTHHDGNAQNLTTFVSNHDAGRFGYYVAQDNPKMPEETRARLTLLANELLLTVRGQPAVYYGDEQGMVGIGGDKGAREDMFASRTPDYMALSLLGTKRTGKDDKFDPGHPFYQRIAQLSAIRRASQGLSTGAMLVRPSGDPRVFAFSRIGRDERREYLVAVNQSSTEERRVRLATSQRAGARLVPVFAPDGDAATLVAAADGTVSAALPPLGIAVWRAEAALGAPASAPSIVLSAPAQGSALTIGSRSIDGHSIPVRQEVRAEVAGNDGLAEVTFVMARASRPGQFELLGTADAPPYRVFFRPPADLAQGDALTFIATVDDLRGHQASAQVASVTVAPGSVPCGVRGATVPLLATEPAPQTHVAAGGSFTLGAAALGTAPLDYRWLHNGREVAGAAGPELRVAAASFSDAGEYRVLVHNLEGTAVSAAALVRVGP